MSDNTSKFTLVCFPCRYTAKATWINSGKSRRCPHCGGGLENVGKHFNIPKKSDDKAWETSEAWQRQRQRQMTQTMDEWRAEISYEMGKRWAARRHAGSTR